MRTIAIIDDDVHIGNMLEEVLRESGYGVIRAYSGTEALMLLDRHRPDLILLDLMLPGLSGEDILPQIKNMPVIIMSAKVDVNDKISLLLSGASDYIAKPFDIGELLARITVQLRNYPVRPIQDTITVGELVLDCVSLSASVRGEDIRLTKTEFAILRLLAQNPGRIIAKSVILDRISDSTPDCTDGSLKQHICNLRKKLRDCGGGDCIEAIWGIGFKITY